MTQPVSHRHPQMEMRYNGLLQIRQCMPGIYEKRTLCLKCAWIITLCTCCGLLAPSTTWTPGNSTATRNPQRRHHVFQTAPVNSTGKYLQAPSKTNSNNWGYTTEIHNTTVLYTILLRTYRGIPWPTSLRPHCNADDPTNRGDIIVRSQSWIIHRDDGSHDRPILPSFQASVS